MSTDLWVLNSTAKYYIYIIGFQAFQTSNEKRKMRGKTTNLFSNCVVYTPLLPLNLIVTSFSFNNMKDDLQSTRQAAASACEPVILASGHTGLSHANTASLYKPGRVETQGAACRWRALTLVGLWGTGGFAKKMHQNTILRTFDVWCLMFILIGLQPRFKGPWLLYRGKDVDWKMGSRN